MPVKIKALIIDDILGIWDNKCVPSRRRNRIQKYSIIAEIFTIISVYIEGILFLRRGIVYLFVYFYGVFN